MMIGDMLVAEGVITAEQLSQALAKQKSSPDKKLGEVLLEMDLIDIEQFMKILERQMKDAGLK